MAFPTTLQNPKADWNGTDEPVGHSSHHNVMATLLIALQTKLGIDGSADTNSVDYKLAQIIASAVKVVSDEIYLTASGGIFVQNAMEVSSYLSVVGGGASLFQLQSAGYGAGKVLTSDANGNANWSTPSSTDTNAVHKTGDESVDGIKTFQKVLYGNYNNTVGGLGIAANGLDHVYYGWYVNLVRKAYMGFAAAGHTTLQINNEMTNGDINLVTNGDINLVTNGTGAVKVNGVNIVTDVKGALQTVNAQTGTTYTFALVDSFSMVTLNNASAITATVPPNSSVAFPIGTQIDICQLGAGKVTVAQGAGVTINSKGGNKALSAQYVAGTLKKIATDTWLLFGDLIA